MYEEKNDSEENDGNDANEALWREYVSRKEWRGERTRLELSDYLALFIAALQTVVLPLIILMIVLAGFGFIFIFWANLW